MVDAIAGEEQVLHRIESKFRERAGEPENPVVRAVSWVLGYRLLGVSEVSARSRYGAPFAPAMEFQEAVFPPYLDAIRDREDTLVVWIELAGLVRHPVIKARVSDLVWCVASGGDRHRHARNAIEAYLAAASLVVTSERDTERLLDRAYGLVRALELSLEINAPDLRGRVSDRIAETLRIEMQAEDAGSRPGVWMRLLTPLVDLEADERPDDLGELLGRAHTLVIDRPNVRLSLFQMEERLARRDQSAARRIGRSAVAMLVMHARREASGLAKQHWAHGVSRAREIERTRSPD